MLADLAAQPKIAVPLESPKLMDGRSGAGHDYALKVRVACAGPLPVLGPGDEAGVNGVPLNVIADALEFGGIPNPMIEGFVLP